MVGPAQDGLPLEGDSAADSGRIICRQWPASYLWSGQAPPSRMEVGRRPSLEALKAYSLGRNADDEKDIAAVFGWAHVKFVKLGKGSRSISGTLIKRIEQR